MNLTLDGYADNPMGKQNAVFSQRSMYKTLYSEKWDKILLREAGKIDYKLFTYKDKYYIYLKIPSEVIKNFYYDVVVEFYTTQPPMKNARSLKDYYVRFYSNDPNFVFTFAHAFIKNDMFIKELEPKMSKKAVRKRAVEKNPKEIVGYVKSLYFAYLFIKSKGLLNKIQFETYGSKLDFKALLRQIEHADSKIEKRQKAEEELNKKNKKEKENKIRASEENRKNLIAASSTHRSKSIGIVKPIKKIQSTSKIKPISKISSKKH